MRHAWIVILLLGLQLVPIEANSFSMETVLEKFSRDLWHVGKGITPGDSFLYAVCDFKHRFLAQSGPCYHIRMDFYIQLESQERNVWVVQAEISDADNTNPHRHIFLMDSETLDITTDHIGSDYASSMEKTVLYLAQFAHEQTPKSLIVGDMWGSVSSTLDVGSDLMVISKEKDSLGDVHILEFGLFESSIFTISKDIPFPVSASVYDSHIGRIEPPVLFTFELLEHTSDHMVVPDSQNTTAVIPDAINGSLGVSQIASPYG